MAITTTLESMVSVLFTAPAAAVLEAERNYRTIWSEWLKDLQNLIKAAGPESEETMIEQHLKLAPVMKIGGNVDLGITMRIASVSQKDLSLKVDLGVGPIGVSGSFGFMGRHSEESVFQAHAQYSLTNTEVDLKTFMEDSQLELATSSDLEKAITFLAAPGSDAAGTTTEGD